jgi:hypothetical protein
VSLSTNSLRTRSQVPSLTAIYKKRDPPTRYTHFHTFPILGPEGNTHDDDPGATVSLSGHQKLSQIPFIRRNPEQGIAKNCSSQHPCYRPYFEIHSQITVIYITQQGSNIAGLKYISNMTYTQVQVEIWPKVEGRIYRRDDGGLSAIRARHTRHTHLAFIRSFTKTNSSWHEIVP